MGCLSGGYLAVQGPQNDKQVGWVLHSSTRNPVFGMGELFLSPASLCCPREMGISWWRDAWYGTCMPNPPAPVLHCSLCLPQPWAKQTWFLTLFKELKGNPHGFCRSRVSGKTPKNHWFMGLSKSPTAHLKILTIDLNTVDKNQEFTASVFIYLVQFKFYFLCLK